MKLGEKMVNPCLHCTLHDGQECDNKLCRRWQTWFLHRWRMIHGYWQQHGQEGKQ